MKEKVMNSAKPGGCGARQGAVSEVLQAGSVREPGGRQLPLSKRRILSNDNATRRSGRAVGLFPQSFGSALSSALSITDWVGLIRQASADGTANTLRLGRLLSEARESLRLRYGAWSRFWRSRGLPFAKRKGEMFVTIGKTLGELDAQNCAQLPLAWSTVYFLALLGRPTVEGLIAQGRIHPGITLRETRALLAEQTPGIIQNTRRSTVKQRLDRLAAFVRKTKSAWTDEERRLAHSALLRLAEQVQPGSDAPTATTNQVRFQSVVSGSSPNRIHHEIFPSFDTQPKHPQAMA